ncbi:ThuA domain-containing protein [Siphonobacter curvatus]|uniref:Glycosyl hydrolase n=1 Tax=Siphonobacter curvatus TaxID=2094562 RepID=A0A2S7IID2_9BACT|nr:ThuA domain-containing protein [Siphonobacter curvatus]PQA55705.1 glycosyl hydrolase [Siphonobacter curvatus]
MKKLILLCCFLAVSSNWIQAQSKLFRVAVLAEKDGGVHAPFVAAAKTWLAQLATQQAFSVDYLEDTQPITDAFLAQHALIIQLNYPPYRWTEPAKKAFTTYIEKGKGGWIGFHHATLLGEFDGYPMWPWFSEFMGGIVYKNYIPDFATATVRVETGLHPVMKGVPASFEVAHEEWYTYNRSPRPRVKVLAAVDESSYKPDSKIKMGDHPVIWSNEKMKARNVYIFMGHHPDLFQNQAFTTVFRNAVLWASQTR